MCSTATVFLYHIPNYHGEDSWHPIVARDSEQAAELAGARYDQDEHPLLRDESETVVVYIKRDDAPPEEKPERFVVHASISYDYFADRKERKEGDKPDNCY